MDNELIEIGKVVYLDNDFCDRIKCECFTEDQEINHMNADDILCEALLSAGFTRTVEAFRSVQKQYA